MGVSTEIRRYSFMQVDPLLESLKFSLTLTTTSIYGRLLIKTNSEQALRTYINISEGKRKDGDIFRKHGRHLFHISYQLHQLWIN